MKSIFIAVMEIKTVIVFSHAALKYSNLQIVAMFHSIHAYSLFMLSLCGLTRFLVAYGSWKSPFNYCESCVI